MAPRLGENPVIKIEECVVCKAEEVSLFQGGL